jgi:DNA-directed RNA polymerase subunit M/transcription elongation factor TFIIS
VVKYFPTSSVNPLGHGGYHQPSVRQFWQEEKQAVINRKVAQSKGKELRRALSFTDITKRKRGEEVLNASHRFLEIANRSSRMAPLLEARLFRLRWPEGFKCPRCGHSEAYFHSTRHLYQLLPSGQ